MVIGFKSSSTTKLNGKELSFVFNNLAMLINSGMSMVKALEVLCDVTKGNHHKAFCLLYSSIKEGNSFSSSCLAITSEDMYISLLAMGEEMGRLEEVLYKLAVHIEEKESYKNKIIKLSIYPIILLISTIAVSFFICFFILPNIVGMFGNTEGSLPAYTKLILAFVNSLKREPEKVISRMILTTAAIVLTLHWMNNTFYFFSKATGGIIFRLWEINFLKVLGLSITSGSSIMQAIGMIMSNEKNPKGKSVLLNINNDIMNGSQLSEAFHKERDISRVIISFIAIGEESGNLDKYLKICQELLEKKYYEGLNRYMALLQPLLLVIMGLIIISLIYSVFMPMMNNMYNI